jgi:hypothetical protein
VRGGHMDSQSQMRCPHCEARYIVVKAEANQTTVDREITCLGCGSSLKSRDGRFILKYFLAEEPRKQDGKRYAGARR